MQKTNKNISPIKNSPLRYPGQSLQEEINSILFEKIMPTILGIFMLFFMFFYDLYRLYFNLSPQPLLWLLAGVLISVFYYKKISDLWKKFNKVKLGYEGECEVGQCLDELKKDGHVVFHDLVNGEFNIDHIVIGPGGVYAIETKTRSNKNGNNKVIFNGREIVINGYHDNIPILEAKSHANWLKDFLINTAKIEIIVKPVVIYAGNRFIEQTVPNSDIWVLNVKALSSYLNNEKSILSTDQINLISSHIETYIRNYKE